MKRWWIVFLLAVLATAGFAQEKRDINNQSVSNPNQLRQLLVNRFGLVEDDIVDLQSGLVKGIGKFYYVDSTHGSDTYTGLDWVHPLATIDAAYNLCTTSHGDRIYVAQAHTESWTTTALTLDKIGVWIIGCGNGANKPIIEYTGASGLCSITGASNRITNIAFRAHVTSVTKAINITGDDCVIDNCDFLKGQDGSAVDEFSDAIINAAGADRTIIANCTFYTQRGDASATGIKLSGASVSPRIVGNTFLGAYSTAAINGITTACTEVEIRKNRGADVVLYGITTGLVEDNGYPYPNFLVQRQGQHIGNVYYVDAGSTGPVDNYESGTSPLAPKRTITAALAKCVSGHNDYIFVLNYGSNGRAAETFPITMTKDMVHLIGLTGSPAAKWPTVSTLTATTNTSAIVVTGEHCEIANLEIGGTGTAAGILLGTADPYDMPYFTYIHDCLFGITGDTVGTNGVRVDASCDAPGTVIERCKFGNALTGTGVLVSGVMTRGQIVGNLFLTCTAGINIVGATGGIITDNQFCLDADTNGDAITLGSGTTLLWINNNSAHYGKTAISNKPYTDGSSTNSWGINYKGILPALPAT